MWTVYVSMKFHKATLSRFIKYFLDSMPCAEEPLRVRVKAICVLAVVPAGFLFSSTLPWTGATSHFKHFKQPTQPTPTQPTQPTRPTGPTSKSLQSTIQSVPTQSIESIQFPATPGTPVALSNTTISGLMTTKTTMTTMTSLPWFHHLNPWIPYQLDAQGFEQVERGLNFTLGCSATCRAKMLRCNELEVPRCFDMDCHCSKGFLLPSELQTSVSTHDRIAVVIAGQTRSFYSELMNEYWRLFLARFHGDAVVFAVLTTVSGQKVRDRTGIRRKKGQEWSKFTVRELQKRLDNLNVTWDAVFLDEMCSGPVAMKYIKDPTLRDMLTPGKGGYENLFRARVIAFDRLLSFERRIGHRFQHVIVLRPDIVTYLGNDDPVLAVSSVKDSVLCFNDMAHMFERKFATYVFTVPATMRSFHSSTTDQDAHMALHWKTWNRSHTHGAGRIILPLVHLGYHGIPFCGESLQAVPTIPCKPGGFGLWIGIVRDLWRVKGPQRVCLDLRRGSLTNVQDYFRRLGVRESLLENFNRCHEDM